MQTTRQPFSRAPNGVLSKDPIYVRLSEEEHALFVQRALAEHRSLSGMGRILILQALHTDKEQDNSVSVQQQADFIERS
jgi:hypothetical protein